MGTATPVARLDVEHDSSTNDPTLRLHETQAEFARLAIGNTNTERQWQIAGLVAATQVGDRLNFWNSAQGDILTLWGAGAAQVFGTFSASGTKSFQIDHPLDPENHYLNHFCTEGPEPYNVYRGNVITDARGYATVELPEYFDKIDRNPTYDLTVIDGGDDFVLVKVVREVQNNVFTIRTSAPRTKVSWRVEAIRNDRWVQRYGYLATQEKEEENRGRYVSPELYGQPVEMGIPYHSEGPSAISAMTKRQ